MRTASIGKHAAFAARELRSASVPDCDVYAHSTDGLLVVAEGRLFARGGGEAGKGIAKTIGDLYRRWADDLIQHMDGEFAFVIWDQKRQCVVAAVDALGIRPLYYRHENGASFGFASSPYTLAAMLGLDARVDESRVVEQLVLAMEVVESWNPLVLGISRLEGGHLLVATRENVNTRRYWSPAQASSPGLRDTDIKGWVEGVEWHVREAVQKRMGQCGRMGVLLSGGLDSSVVAALASDMQAEMPLDCYSLIDNSRSSCVETAAINTMRAAFPLELHSIDCSSHEVDALEARALISRSPRFLSGRGAFLHLSFARAASAGVGILMDGIDADSLFAHGSAKEWVARGLWHDLKSNRRKLKRLRPGYSTSYLNPLRGAATIALGPALKPLLKQYRHNASIRWFLRMSLLNESALQRFGIRERLREYQDRMDAYTDRRARRIQRSAMDSPIIEDGVRRMGARAAEHEVRLTHPFMDRQLIEFCAWIPPQLMLKNGRTKWIMRKAANAWLPHSVCWRGDKHDIGFKFDRAVLQPVLDRLEVDLANGAAAVQAYVQVPKVQALIAQWRVGNIDAICRLTDLLLLENWLQYDPSRVRWGH